MLFENSEKLCYTLSPLATTPGTWPVAQGLAQEYDYRTTYNHLGPPQLNLNPKISLGHHKLYLFGNLKILEVQKGPGIQVKTYGWHE